MKTDLNTTLLKYSFAESQLEGTQSVRTHAVETNLRLCLRVMLQTNKQTDGQ